MHTSRRNFLRTAGLATAAASSLQAETRSSTPVINIIYIHSHDSGRYLRPYGYSVPTPNLLRLAQGGVLFRQMHSGAPTCSPSRAALLTGQPSHASGMLGLAHRGWGLNDYRQHMLHSFKAAGYFTMLCGLQHVASDPTVIGFDKVAKPKDNHAANVAPIAVEFLRSRPTKPFFLDIGFQETHRPYHPPTDNADYITSPAPILDTPSTRYDMAGFHESARQLDKAVGAVLDALEEAGLAKNTLVLSTTDHGVAFPEMKCDLRDTGTGVSCILRGPGIFTGPKVCDALLSHTDIYPTLCEYLGLPKPSWLTGKSFLPVLEGKTAEVNDAVFAEVTYHAAYEPKRSVRTHRYKYIRHYNHRTKAVLPNCDAGPAKTEWLKAGWQSAQLIDEEELFDLTFDVSEHRNLAHDPAHAATLSELRNKLDAWMKATNDPLLKGDIPLPPGGYANGIDEIDPERKPGPGVQAPHQWQ